MLKKLFFVKNGTNISIFRQKNKYILKMGDK